MSNNHFELKFKTTLEHIYPKVGLLPKNPHVPKYPKGLTYKMSKKFKRFNCKVNSRSYNIQIDIGL